MTTIRNPVEWTGHQLSNAAQAAANVAHSFHHVGEAVHAPVPAVRKIGIADVRDALRKGWGDFGAYRTDVVFISAIYVAVGLVLSRLAFGLDLLPLVFPLASGFAIVGPIAAIGLYELSRRREQGLPAEWRNAFDVFRAPSLASIMVVGLMLIAIFLFWLAAAWGIFEMTLGPREPASIGAFLHDVFLTGPGRIMIVAGIGVGFLFALLAMTISIVSLPMLIDRDIGFDTAIKTSVRAVLANPVPMAVWGFVVAAALLLGSLPLFVGLAVVVPVLGHATWHLYRKLVV